jgi:spectinomycin phosphotransferase
MLEKPALPDTRIVAGLREAYGIAAAGLDFLPIGYDANAWVYRVTADDGAEYFLKVRRGQLNAPGLLIPRFLRDQGIESVVAPLRAADDRPWAALDGFKLVLYPYLAGENGYYAGLSDAQWMAFGTTLRQIHAVDLPADLAAQMRVEAFVSRHAPIVRALSARIAAGEFAGTDPHQRELASFWQARQAEIDWLLDRTEALSGQLRARPMEPVVCHADIHTHNVLIDGEGRLWIVDWDETLLAPRERDLMFIGAGIDGPKHGPRETALFYQGYGDVIPDPLALAYYRIEWAVQDLGEFGMQVFEADDVGAETKADAVRLVKGMFQPGHSVDRARASEAALRSGTG